MDKTRFHIDADAGDFQLTLLPESALQLKSNRHTPNRIEVWEDDTLYYGYFIVPDPETINGGWYVSYAYPKTPVLFAMAMSVLENYNRGWGVGCEYGQKDAKANIRNVLGISG